VGLTERTTCPPEQREPGRSSSRAPRSRLCLLKGCEGRFHPRRAGERYCSEECRRAARRWSRWKAQQSYRATAAGKEKRNGQSRRYRRGLRNRRQTPPDGPIPESARVITGNFFRPLLRPARLLRGIHSRTPFAPAALLFTRLPAGHGTSLATRAALAPRDAAAVEDLNRPAADKPDVLIRGDGPAYIQPVE
jgi:hypothetical protein